jgi:hypothetical protein
MVAPLRASHTPICHPIDGTLGQNGEPQRLSALNTPATRLMANSPIHIFVKLGPPLISKLREHYLIDVRSDPGWAEELGQSGFLYDPLGRLQQVAASGTTQYPHDGGMLVSPRYSNLSATRE